MMQLTNPRIVNEANGLMLDGPDGVALYLDAGELYDEAMRGAFGPVAPFVPPPPDPAQMIAGYDAAVQRHVDAVAQARQYRDGVHCASYTTSTRAVWQAEALAFVAWRDAVWTQVNDLLEAVLAGKLPVPTVDEVIDRLPAMKWPEVK